MLEYLGTSERSAEIPVPRSWRSRPGASSSSSRQLLSTVLIIYRLASTAVIISFGIGHQLLANSSNMNCACAHLLSKHASSSHDSMPHLMPA